MSRLKAHVCVAALLLSAHGFASPAQPQATTAAVVSSFGSYKPPRPFSEQVTTTFYLPMRDGTRLAVGITRPARNGKPVEGRFPVIWQHGLSAARPPSMGSGPYSGFFGDIPRLTDHGYVVAEVARRGNGQSFGTRRGYHDRTEAYDAYELVEWLARQPWSSGAVGLFGCSNTGDAAMHVATVRPPHLKAIFAGCFSWNKYDAMRRGGIFAQWGTGPERTVEEDMRQSPVDGDESKTLLRQAAQEHQRATPLLDVWKSLPYRNSWTPLLQSAFWAEGSTSSYADQIRQSGAKVYIVGGWRDEFRDQGFISYLNIPGSKILVGDWLHCQSVGFELAQEAHRFFDQWLKGVDTGITRDPPIHYFTVGANGAGEWRSAFDWPLVSAAPQRFVLGRGRSLAANGRPSTVSESFKVEAPQPCPGAGGAMALPCHVPGRGVSFATGPLSSDVEMTGHGIADLWIATTADDASLFLFVEDVAPDGKVTVITEGRLKASLRKISEAPWKLPGIPWHRAHLEDVEKLQPGKPVRMQFDLLPLSYVFRKGHRLQISLAGSDPRERGRVEGSETSQITVLGGAGMNSFVSLPVVASGSARGE